MSFDSSVGSDDSDSPGFQPAQQVQLQDTDNSDIVSSASEDPLEVQDDESRISPQREESVVQQGDLGQGSPQIDTNRAHGPPSKWKRSNALEINLATSLDQSTAHDLSIHLYNAFKLRQQGLSQRLKTRRETSENPVQDPAAFTWIPPKDWTAWPLPSDQVPQEHTSGNTQVLPPLPPPYLTKPAKLSQHLRELLLAQVLRQAKFQYYDRESGLSEDTSSEEEPFPPKHSLLDRSTDSTDSSSLDDSPSSEPATKSIHKVVFPSNIDESDLPSQGEAKPLKPVIIADDAQAMSLLRPTIQSIMDKLDQLLMSLHDARQSYSSVNAGNSPEDTGIDCSSKPRSRSVKQPRDCSTRDRASSTVIDEDMSTDNESTFGSRPARKRRFSSRSQRFRQRKRKLGLRNWSDVFGIALMSGVDQAVARRSARRCKDLFDEEMEFRTLHESYRETNRNSQSSGQQRRSDSMAEQLLGGVHVDGFLQPIKAKRSWRAQSGKQK